MRISAAGKILGLVVASMVLDACEKQAAGDLKQGVGDIKCAFDRVSKDDRALLSKGEAKQLDRLLGREPLVSPGDPVDPAVEALTARIDGLASNCAREQHWNRRQKFLATQYVIVRVGEDMLTTALADRGATPDLLRRVDARLTPAGHAALAELKLTEAASNQLIAASSAEGGPSDAETLMVLRMYFYTRPQLEALEREWNEP